jgi:hypothetical protein
MSVSSPILEFLRATPGATLTSGGCLRDSHGVDRWFHWVRRYRPVSAQTAVIGSNPPVVFDWYAYPIGAAFGSLDGAPTLLAALPESTGSQLVKLALEPGEQQLELTADRLEFYPGTILPVVTTTGDFDGDGVTDVATLLDEPGPAGQYSLNLHLRSPDGGLDAVARSPFPSSLCRPELVAADLSRNGRDELYVASAANTLDADGGRTCDAGLYSLELGALP